MNIEQIIEESFLAVALDTLSLAKRDSADPDGCQCTLSADEATALWADREGMKAEVARLQKKCIGLAIDWTDVSNQLMAVERERDQLKSWEASIRAEITPPISMADWDANHDNAEYPYSFFLLPYLQKKCEHLAAKLVEAREVMRNASNRIALTMTGRGMINAEYFDQEINGAVSDLRAHCQPAPLSGSYTNRHEVMNPPASAAMGAEARNLKSANFMGLGEVHRASEARPADDVPAPGGTNE